MRFVSVVKNTGGMDPEAQTKTCHVNTVRRDSSHGHDVHTRGMPRSVTVTSHRLVVCARGHKNWGLAQGFILFASLCSDSEPVGGRAVRACACARRDRQASCKMHGKEDPITEKAGGRRWRRNDETARSRRRLNQRCKGGHAWSQGNPRSQRVRALYA